jgi:hypothetical protein
MAANPDTPFLGFKTDLKEINEETKKIMKAIKHGSFTDDTFMLLEIALKQLQLQAYELGKKTLQGPGEPTSNDEPLDPTKAIYEFINAKTK